MVNALRGFEYASVVALIDLLGVIHATIANFDGIPVEDFSKFDLYESVYLVGREICTRYFC